jgi:hypothetical protein
MLYHGSFLPMEPFINVLANMLANLNYWGVHPVVSVSSNVNKPPYATMFFGTRFYIFGAQAPKKHCCVWWFINITVKK